MKPTRPSYAILGAALIGSVVEWYDLFVYGTLVVTLSVVFFPASASVAAILPALGAFVAGAAVRPLGGILFGRYGDLIGRKFAFVLTTMIMGLGSVGVGLLPTYNQVGILAPIALVSLRIVQGLALGGEYGGAATYIAENAADKDRGFWTSFTQSAATVGLLLATVVSLATRIYLGNVAFQSWGWRIPFLGAAFLLAIALVIRWRLTETALFTTLKNIKKTSPTPLSDSVARKANLKLILLALVVVSGASVVWHTAQFYTAIFIQNTLKIDFLTAAVITSLALALGAPFFVLFGWLSDRIGRLKIMLIGSVIGAISFYPTYYLIHLYSHPPNLPILTAMLFAQIFLSAMCYGPMGAFLVEFFPAKVRYTSTTISHGVGTGDVGDGTLVIAPILVLLLGNIYAGLIWSSMIPILTSLVAFHFIKETKEKSIWTEVIQ
jgi:MFS family permease